MKIKVLSLDILLTDLKFPYEPRWYLLRSCYKNSKLIDPFRMNMDNNIPSVTVEKFIEGSLIDRLLNKQVKLLADFNVEHSLLLKNDRKLVTRNVRYSFNSDGIALVLDMLESEKYLINNSQPYDSLRKKYKP